MQKLAEIVQNIHERPRIRALFFFAFYALFVILVLFSLNSSETISKTPSENHFPFSITMFENPNYHFSYQVFTNQGNYEYVGDRLLEQESFSYLGKNYFFDGTKYYVDFVEVEDPYILEDFKDSHVILSLLKNAYFESKTIYESGKTSYRYAVDSNIIFEVTENLITDYEGEVNTLVVSINEDGNIEKIVFQLDDYCAKSAACAGNLKIEMTYEKLGEIQSLMR
ncbi:MAG: hypothetical protein IJI60_01305 [Bacilli bacterium]|nr:hypothetical protein [Bacilli bacterium]